MNTQAYPLKWPDGYTRTEQPKESRFGSWNKRPTVHKATQELQQELRRLGATNVVISTNLTLRNDGLPRSNQRAPEDAGAAVYFTESREQRVIACDAYKTVGENLYAIAKTIDAMRGIDRWGCSDILNRMFDGFKALPEKAGTSGYWSVLGVEPGINKEDARKAYREKAKAAHPDTGGSQEQFQEVQDAWTLYCALNP